jgi:prevent-host-death family protein
MLGWNGGGHPRTFSLALNAWRFHIRREGAAMSIATVPLAAGAATGAVPDAVERVAHDDVRVVLTRGGEPVAAIVPLDDLRALEELDAAEDEYWSRAADEAVARWEAEGRPRTISHDDICREFGIDPAGEPNQPE